MEASPSLSVSFVGSATSGSVSSVLVCCPNTRTVIWRSTSEQRASGWSPSA